MSPETFSLNKISPEFAEGLSVFGMILAVAGLGMIIKDVAGIGAVSDSSAVVILTAIILSFSSIVTSVAAWAIVVEAQK